MTEPKAAGPFDGLVRGRIVHYTPRNYEARGCDDGPWAAVVSHVQPLDNPETRGKVTLHLMMPRVSMSIGNDPVSRMENVPYAETATAGSWSWMFAGQGTRYTSEPPAALPTMKPEEKPKA